MTFGTVEILTIIGSLCLFIYGMKTMSDGLQRAAGAQLRQSLKSVTKNKFFGTLTGFAITSFIQSSSATTVMIVSFVNAGLFTVSESVGLLFGANIGTTVTGWLVSFLGFKIKLTSIAVPLCVIAVPMILSNKNRFKYWGEALLGFAILFISLGFLKNSVPDFNNNPEALDFLANYTDSPISVVLFFVIGIILTIVVQSSSASITLIMVLCLNGLLNYKLGAAMVIGANIGTVITAEIAALIGNIYAKQAARAHTVFNILGAVIALLFFPFLLNFGDWIHITLFDSSSAYDNAAAIPLTLSIIHSIFNLTNVLIWVWFVPVIIRIVEWTVRSKSGIYRDSLALMKRPFGITDITMVELISELQSLGKTISQMHEKTKVLLLGNDPGQTPKLLNDIYTMEQATDMKNRSLTEYVQSTHTDKASEQTLHRLQVIFLISNDLERTADLYAGIANSYRDKTEQRIWFDTYHRDRITHLLDLLEPVLAMTLDAIQEGTPPKPNMESFNEIHRNISGKRNEFRADPFDSDPSDKNATQRALIFNNICDYLENISKILFAIYQLAHRKQ